VRPAPSVRWLVVFVGASLVGLGLLWLRARPWASRTVNRPAVLGAAAGLSGLVGTVLLAWTIVLSARLRLVEAAAGGLDKVYRLHHRLGGVTFAVLALHPVLLSWRYAQVSWDRAAELWWPNGGGWYLRLGQLALYGLAAGMVATLYLSLRHRAMVWVQRGLGVLFVPAALHAFGVGGDLAEDPALRWYVGTFAVAACLALVVHTVAGRWTARHAHYRVAAVNGLSPTITELVLTPVGRGMTFEAGQFAFVRVPHGGVGAEPHPFSMASPPGDRRLRFTVKHLGDDTSRFGELQPGADAVVEGPYGRFGHRRVAGRRQAWIAGGIGIAPFLSMVTDLDADHDVTLLYGYADDGPPAVLAELRAAAARTPNLRVALVDEHRDGRIDVARLRAVLGELDDVEFLVCGPPPMLHALRAQLAGAGVAAGRLHDEEFAF